MATQIGKMPSSHTVAITVGDETYARKRCYEKALEASPMCSGGKVWKQLAQMGGGTVRGKEYDADACEKQRLRLTVHNPGFSPMAS